MKVKNLTAFDWVLLGCVAFLAVAIIIDAFNGVLSRFSAEELPMGQPTGFNRAMAADSRHSLIT